MRWIGRLFREIVSLIVLFWRRVGEQWDCMVGVRCFFLFCLSGQLV